VTVNTADLFADLMILRRAWEGRREAAGGFAAMAGFDFQMTKAVLTIIRRSLLGGGATFVEALSDIMEADKGLVITQAKRTLASSSLHSALAELWEIYLLARDKTPTLVDHIRFQVVSRKRVLLDSDASIRKWTPDGATPAELSDFKAKVKVMISPDPRLDPGGLAVSGNQDSDPLARFDRLGGRLRHGTADTIEAFVGEFRVELEAQLNAARDREARFELWGHEDRAPDSVERQGDERLAVRIGERLTLEDLREGRLASRRIYDEIETQCEQWLAADSDPYALPTYWLSGRSGCGKSAALLHLAARLHEENPDRVIIHLGERVGRIAEAVSWAAPQLRAGRTVILVIDDPFTAARQQAFARSVEQAQLEWERIRGLIAADERRPPMLLCCGPTEQRASAEEHCGAHLACDGFDLPNETREDLEELATWYAARTGRAVTAMEGNVLLVQQMFEWTKGDIKDFSRGFRDRIRAFDAGVDHGALFSLVAQILALNRLYVDYPATQLEAQRDADPALDAALIQLGEAESHLDFGGAGRGGVRLTHPHLANEIYEAWFSRPTDRPHRKRHLQAALSLALDQPDMLPEIRHAPLWAIARLSRATNHFGTPLDPAMKKRIDFIGTELRQVLTGLYAERVDSGAPLEDLPVWVGLRDQLGLSLSPDPVARLIEAVDAADQPVRGLRLSCHHLLNDKDSGAAGRACVERCLNRMAVWRDLGGGWHDWVPLAMHFVDVAGYAPMLDSIGHLVRTEPYLRRLPQLVHAVLDSAGSDGRAIALDWLETTSDNSVGWVYLLEKLQQQEACERSDAIALRFLASARGEPAWAFIWLNLRDVGRCEEQTLIDDARLWLRISEIIRGEPVPIALGWDRVWKRLVDDCGADNDERALLLEAGLVWATRIDADHGGWTWVWEKLWAHAETAADDALRTRLVAVAEEKLDRARITLVGWPHVWKVVADAADAETKPYFHRLGIQWLREVSFDQTGWPHVWEKLYLEAGDAMRPELLERGVKWLDLVEPEVQGWSFVWRNVAAAGAASPHATNRALAVLRSGDPDHPGWIHLASPLMAVPDPSISDEARLLVRQWLVGRIELSSWGPICKIALKPKPAPDQIQPFSDYCWAVLEDAAASPRAKGRAWDALTSLGLGQMELADAALTLLEDCHTPIDVQISICGRALRFTKIKGRRGRLTGHAIRLIDPALADETWLWLWQGLVAVDQPSDNKRLAAVARDRMRVKGPEHPHWSRVFRTALYLDRSISHDVAIRAQATEWLAAAPPDEIWIKVWGNLQNSADLLDDPRVYKKAHAAVGNVAGNRAWGRLLTEVWLRAPEGEKPAVARGRAWLEAEGGHESWSGVWTELYALSAGDETESRALIELALSSLATEAPTSAWLPIFKSVLAVKPEALKQANLEAAALAWLCRFSADARDWLLVWHYFMSTYPHVAQDPAVRAHLTEALGRAFATQGAWSRYWSVIIKALSPPRSSDLEEFGFCWLANAAPDQRPWPFVWITLWGLMAGDRAGRDRLRGFGAEWLALASGHERADIVAIRVGQPWVAHGANRQKKLRKGKTPNVAAGGL